MALPNFEIGSAQHAALTRLLELVLPLERQFLIENDYVWTPVTPGCGITASHLLLIPRHPITMFGWYPNQTKGSELVSLCIQWDDTVTEGYPTIDRMIAAYLFSKRKAGSRFAIGQSVISLSYMRQVYDLVIKPPQ